MILGEAVTNAGSHGQQRWIEISARYDQSQMLFRIDDDGVGFDVKTAILTPAEDHCGICCMQDKAEMIGAMLEMTSEGGVGTQVLVSLSVGP